MAAPLLEDLVPARPVERAPGRLPEQCAAGDVAAVPVDHLHVAGALNEHEGDDGAVGNRDAHYIGGFAGTATRRPRRSPCGLGPGRVGADPPFSTGGTYVNFLLAEDDTGRTAAAYGSGYQRLQTVKATYDPDNLFRVNRNIPPARQ